MYYGGYGMGYGGYGMGYYPYSFHWSWTFLLVIAGVVICMAASARMRRTFQRYAKMRSMSGMTGLRAAEKILRAAGISDVRINHIKGSLTDHYNPIKKTLSLSDPVYGQTSVAAVGVAAHECGHAIQHQKKYVPLRLRGAMVPVARIGSGLSWPLIIIGMFLGGGGSIILQIGIWMFFIAVLFQLVTLPVEFNASHRALKQLEKTGILGHDELRHTRKVLRAAAMTYVASAAAMILQFLRLLLIYGARRH